MKQINSWGNIKFVCACCKDDIEHQTFILDKEGGLIYYKCTNPECNMAFPADIHFKMIEKLNKYIKENRTPDKFATYFKNKGESFKVTYIKTRKITKDYNTHYLLVTKMGG